MLAPSLEARIKAQAAELGFVACGITDVSAVAQAGPRLRAWLADGAHGEMAWMAARADERASPAALWRDARSAIMLGMSYAPARDPRSLEGETRIGRISTYAQGQDYHDVVRKALKSLARWLISDAGGGLKVFVDTAPLMEKPLAAAAGLGWQGKHTNLVSREEGSWLLLGAILTTLELRPDPPGDTRCGSCEACRTACPTGAIPAPYQLDARACLSYLTIEHQGPIPERYRAAMGNRIYGCDDCLAACPWNKFAASARANRAFAARAELAAPELADLLVLDAASFRQVFAGSPIKRIGRDRMVRNALIAAGNSGEAGLVAPVAALLDDRAAIVRGAAIWALGRLDPAALAAARGRIAAEDDPAVLAEWAAAA